MLNQRLKLTGATILVFACSGALYLRAQAQTPNLLRTATPRQFRRVATACAAGLRADYQRPVDSARIPRNFDEHRAFGPSRVAAGRSQGKTLPLPKQCHRRMKHP